MIELKVVPGAFPMATVTDLPQLAFMRFVFFVAVYALVQSFVIFFLRLVAAFTLHHQMTAP